MSSSKALAICNMGLSLFEGIHPFRGRFKRAIERTRSLKALHGCVCVCVFLFFSLGGDPFLRLVSDVTQKQVHYCAWANSTSCLHPVASFFSAKLRMAWEAQSALAKKRNSLGKWNKAVSEARKAGRVWPPGPGSPPGGTFARFVGEKESGRVLFFVFLFLFFPGVFFGNAGAKAEVPPKKATRC